MTLALSKFILYLEADSMFSKDDLLSSFYSLEELLSIERGGDEKALEEILLKYNLNKPSILIRSEQKPEIDIHCEQIQNTNDGKLWRVEFGGTSLGGLPLGETLALDEGSMSRVQYKGDGKELESLTSYIPDHIGIAPFPRIASLSNPPKITDVRRARPPRLNLLSGGGFNIDRLRYPWCTVGKVITWARYEIPGIFVPLEISGSGTACVVGRNTVLTASHVIPWGAKRWSAQFIPAAGSTVPTQPFGIFNVTSAHGYINTSSVNGYDMAVLRMDKSVGEITGWMGSISDNDDDDLYYDASWTSVGYPTSYQLAQDASLELSIKVQDVDNDDYGSREIETEPFTNKGWSGGPLFSWFKKYKGLELNCPCVAGTLSGRDQDFLDPTRSVFAGGNALVRLISYGRANWG